MDAGEIPADDKDFHKPILTTESNVVIALRELGHEVTVLGVHDDVEYIVSGLKEQNPDIVFNLTEQFRCNRCFDTNIAGLLEMLDIPFTGSGSIGLMLCRDKGLSCELLSRHRIRVPGFAVFYPGKTIKIPKTLHYPFVIKPSYEDASEGISNASLVRDEESLRKRVELVHSHWKQPAKAEEFIEGRELYVSVIGNQRLTVLPPRELSFEADNNNGPVLATYRVKWDMEYQEKWKISFKFAEIENTLMTRVARICKRTYRALRIHDYGRIDLRITPDNTIVILEANANPDISYGDELSESAAIRGISYNALIDRILNMAFHRFNNKQL